MKQVRGMTKLLQLKQDMIAIKFTDGDIQRVFNGKTGSATSQKSQAALRSARLWPPEDLWVAGAGQLFSNGSRENSLRRRYMKLIFAASGEELEAIKKNVIGCMSAQSLFSRRFTLCLACAITMVILTIYSGYSCTRNVNVEKPRDLRSINKVFPNESSQPNKETTSPCLKDVFKDILLVIVYNYPFYDSIPHLVALYKPAFPHLLFCGPPHNSTRPGILTVDIYKGILGYECLGRAIREHPGYKGYFYISDDVILNYWNFPDFDRDKIWESSFSFGSTPVYEPANTNWYWWVSPYGLNNCRRACEDVANMNFGPKKLNVKYHLNTLFKNSNGTLQCFSGRSDILYIPQKHAKAFSILSELFYERKVFLEIAIPTMIRFLEKKEVIGHLPGYYIPGDVRRGDPRVTDSRFFWFVYFPKNKLWFIHPFKLHQHELDSKFNLIMLKFILIEKVRTLTNCKPKLLKLDREST